MTKKKEIYFYNSKTNQMETEKVFGQEVIEWLYCSWLGKLLVGILARPIFSLGYGFFKNLKSSAKQIAPFIKDFNINMDEYQHGSLGDSCSKDNSYTCFNDFFIRKFADGKRNFVQESEQMGAFAEGRYLAFEEISLEQSFPVKGEFLSVSAILKNEKWEKEFDGGPMIIARLCPTDYHRFHFPDSGTVVESYRIPGALYSVNPVALQSKNDIFFINEREVTILSTENFGKLAYVEVGATMVGKIVQSHQGNSFRRGEEKGYFLFGASTVLLFGEKGGWMPSSDILQRSRERVETFVQLGDFIAKRV